VKFAVSPETSGPPAVIVGVAAALVAPSYPLLFVAAVRVIAFWFTVSVFVPLLAVKLASPAKLALTPVRKVPAFIFGGPVRLALLSVAVPVASVVAVPTVPPFNLKVMVFPLTPAPPEVRVADKFAVPPYVPVAAAADMVEVPWVTVTVALALFELPPLSQLPTPLIVYVPTTGILNEKEAEVRPEATVTEVTALPVQPDPAKNVAPLGVEVKVAVAGGGTGAVARFEP